MNYTSNEQLKDHTTLKIGGPAARFYEPESIEDIQTILRQAKAENMPIYVLGNGSNVLFEDAGYDGWIIHIGKPLSYLNETNEPGVIRVGAGTENAQAADWLAAHSLGGFEFASGIPGTIGGAVIMNAGAYDGEFKDILVRVGYLDEHGTLQQLEADQLELGYRHSWFSDHFGIVVYADLRLSDKPEAAIREKMQDLHDKRHAKQPMDKASAGSTFKRPKEGYASALIHQSGLQGLSVGDAMVSTKHAGFLINDNNASCADFLALVEEVKKRVKADSGIDLELEVRFVPKSGC